jgi:hypothetical protein
MVESWPRSKVRKALNLEKASAEPLKRAKVVVGHPTHRITPRGSELNVNVNVPWPPDLMEIQVRSFAFAAKGLGAGRQDIKEGGRRGEAHGGDIHCLALFGFLLFGEPNRIHTSA